MTPASPGGIPQVDGAEGLPDTTLTGGCDAAFQGPPEATTNVHALPNRSEQSAMSFMPEECPLPYVQPM